MFLFWFSLLFLTLSLFFLSSCSVLPLFRCSVFPCHVRMIYLCMFILSWPLDQNPCCDLGSLILFSLLTWNGGGFLSLALFPCWIFTSFYLEMLCSSDTIWFLEQGFAGWVIFLPTLLLVMRISHQNAWLWLLKTKMNETCAQPGLEWRTCLFLMIQCSFSFFTDQHCA